MCGNCYGSCNSIGKYKYCLQQPFRVAQFQIVLFVEGVTIATTFVIPKGAYSKYWLQPNNRGYAYTANIFINAINSNIRATVPNVCLSEFGGSDYL